MKVGNQDNPGHITKEDWTTMAGDCGIHPRLVFRELDRMHSALKSRLVDAAHNSVTMWGIKSEEPIQRVINIINRRLRRIGSLLR
jgi:hypothetical protein